MNDTKPHNMTLTEAVRELEKEGSIQDPIWYQEKETTPEQLEYKLDGIVNLAGQVRISYYGGTRNEVKLVRNGTLAAMLKNRRELHEFDGQ